MNVFSGERSPNSSQSMIKTMLHCDTVQLVNFNRSEKINIGYQFFFFLYEDFIKVPSLDVHCKKTFEYIE
jgi:hypothetical protein